MARSTAAWHFDAELDEVRLISEIAQLAEGGQVNQGKTLQVSATLTSSAELGLGVMGDQRKFMINLFLTVAVATMDSGNICDYSNNFRAFFNVTSMRGIDASKGPSLEQAHSYVRQVEWIARTRARGTLGQMGLAGLLLPKTPPYTARQPGASPSAAMPTKASRRAKGVALGVRRDAPTPEA